jgi:NAD(P)-dependent dehydrogenase (short-subunit alcohol dehydrogenase family)
MGARLLGRKVLITGGTSGIGLASAVLFASEGANVLATGSSARSVAQAQDFHPNVTFVESDARELSAVDGLIGRFTRDMGGIDVLFLNAGVLKGAPIAGLTEADFDESIRVNLRGPWLMLRAAWPQLREGASVIVNTSIANRKGAAGLGVYAASKAATRALVRVAVAELGAKGVRINAISPGPTITPIFKKSGVPADHLAEMARSIASKIPLGRLAATEEIARAALFLASDESSFVHGAELVVDGGMSQV